MHRTIAILHKLTTQSGFARAYPHLRRAKNGVFSIVALSAPLQSCNIRVPKLLIPAVAPPKHVPASRQTAMLVLKHNIYAPKDVDQRFRCVYTQLGVLNTRKNARRSLWDPPAVGAKRVGASQNGAWRIAWRARGPAAGLWCCGKRPCSCLAVWQMSDGAPDARTMCVRAH